jgi:hypothetical protein
VLFAVDALALPFSAFWMRRCSFGPTFPSAPAL